MSDKVVDLEVLIHCPPEEIFHALTEPESVKIWWRSPDFYEVTDFRLDRRRGGNWMLHAVSYDGKPFEVRGRILEYDSPNSLAFSWNPTWQDIPTTNVRITLTPTLNGTLLKLVHSGFPYDGPGYEPHLYGWPHILQWLTCFLEA